MIQATLGNASLSDCIKFAWGIVADAQLAGPDWIKSKDVRFDIVARTSPETPRKQVQLMLRHLLAERLKLELHEEKRSIPHLALLPVRGGATLRAVSDDPGAPPRNPSARGRITAGGMSMELLATLLSRFERRTVVDATGLAGVFEFKLEWTPDDIRAATPDAAADLPAGPSLGAALREQLGLQLEPRRSPLPVLVVDKAEKVPAPN